ncbi:MAG: NAD(P)-binding domain-containing protein [candidate division WOR-3 bacterium]
MKLIGLLAKNAEASLAPRLMARFLRKGRFSYHYQPFSVDPAQFREAYEGLKLLSGVGFNIGAPYRSIAVRYTSELSSEVIITGAMDTLVISGGKDKGHNVQVWAINDFLGEIGFKPDGAKAMVIGAGAAASGAIYAFLSAGAETVWVANKTPEKAYALAARYESMGRGRVIPVALTEGETARVLPDCELVLHATPLGSRAVPMMFPPIRYGSLRPDAVVIDMIYDPLNTPFLVRAGHFATRTYHGLRIFALSLARSWSLWTGRDDARGIWETLNEIVEPAKTSETD